MSFTRKIQSSGPIQLVSGSGVIDLSASSHVSVNELQLTTPLALSQGGLGASYADTDALLEALNLVAGSDIQPYNSKLEDISNLNPSNGQVIKYNSTSGHFEAANDSSQTYSADDSTLQLSEGQFSVKSSGITASQLSSNSVTTSKISDSNVTAAKLAGTSVTAAKLGSDVAGTGLTGGNGSALSIDNSVVVVASGNVSQTLTGTKTFSAPIVGRSTIQQQNSGHSGYSVGFNYESQSTNNSQFSLATVNLDTDAVTFMEAVVNVCSDDLSQCASFKVFGSAKNVNGTCSLLGSAQQEIIYRSDNSIDCSVDVFNASGLFRIRCTGLSSTNLRWHGSVKWYVSPKYTA